MLILDKIKYKNNNLVRYNMGNTLQKDSDLDKRFSDSLLAQEVKKIMMGQTTTYRGKVIKIHLAKACCRDVVKKGIDQDTTNVVSIPFPKALDKNDTRCKIDKICLTTENVGFQIDDDREKYCNKGSNVGDVDLSIIRPQGGAANSTCDMFMIDYCAKTLYDQGCIKMGKNQAGVIKPQFTNYEENKMCWDADKKMNYGPPECHCLNSIFGPNLNTWPARDGLAPFADKNPYGLESRWTSTDNNSTKYSLNIFGMDSTKQYPAALDTRCSSRKEYGDSGRSVAYTLGRDAKEKSMTICLNQINISDSNIGNANLADINQENDCGGPKATPSKDDIPINIEKKVESDAVAKADADAKAKAKADADAKAKLDADAKKQKEDMEILKKQLDDTKNKANTDLLKAKEEAEKIKAKEEAEKSKAKEEVVKIKAYADAQADIAATKIKNDIETKARLQAELEASLAEQEAKLLAEQEAKLLAEKTSKQRMYYLGGGIGLLLIIGVLFFMLTGSSKNNEDIEDNNESDE